MKYEKTNLPNIVIDPTTNVVLNTDMGGYTAIKKAREENRKSIDLYSRFEIMEKQIQELQAEIDYLRRKIDP